MVKLFLQKLKNYFHNLKTIDIIILIPLLFGAYFGYKKGFSMTIFKILALILGVILGFKLVHVSAQFLAPHIGDANGFLPIISFLAVLILVIVGVNFVGKLVKKVLDMTLLGSFDNIAGAILNLLKWSFIIGTVFWLMERGGIAISEEQTNNSVLYPLLIKASPAIIDFFSQIMPFASDVVDYIKELKITP